MVSHGIVTMDSRELCDVERDQRDVLLTICFGDCGL